MLHALQWNGKVVRMTTLIIHWRRWRQASTSPLTITLWRLIRFFIMTNLWHEDRIRLCIRHWIFKMLARCILSSVRLRLSQFSQLSLMQYMCRYQSGHAPSQRETSLQCNDVYHWLSQCLDWTLYVGVFSAYITNFCCDDCKNICTYIIIINNIDQIGSVNH